MPRFGLATCVAALTLSCPRGRRPQRLQRGLGRGRHCSLQPRDRIRSVRRRRACQAPDQPRCRVEAQGRPRWRHRRLRSGDPAQSGSITSPSIIAATPGGTRGTSTAPSPTTPRHCGSIPAIRPSTSTADWSTSARTTWSDARSDYRAALSRSRRNTPMAPGGQEIARRRLRELPKGP